MKPITLSPDEFAYLQKIELSFEDCTNVATDFSFLKALVAAKSKEIPAFFSPKACVTGEIVLRENESGDNLYII